jgi:hypothetical protein
LSAGTFWLVNKEDHTIRPFEDLMALDAVFGENTEKALKNVVKVSTPIIDEDGEIAEGVLANFTILGPEYTITSDGTSKPLHFSTYQLKHRFGKPINERAEDKAVESLDGFLTILKDNEDRTGIDKAFIDKIKEDDKLMAFYVSCMAYGKYTLKEIYSDIIQTFKESTK